MTYDDLNVHIIRSVDYENDARWKYEINLYPYNTLYFPLSGDGFVKSDGMTTALFPEFVYLIPANTLYSCWCNTFIHKLYVEISLEMVPGMDILESGGGVRAMPFPSARVREMIRRNTDAMADRLWLRGQLLEVASMFIPDGWAPPSGEMLRFKPVLDDIARNLSADIRVKDIAERYGWHPSALSRAFQRAYSCGIKRYVDLLLMNRLKRELIVSGKSLRELAATYQFCDAYYLSAFFKKHEGVSPIAYRKSNRRGA